MASDVAAWEATMANAFCQHIPFPEQHTRWVTAATCGAFGQWTEEGLGFCVYINVLTGSQWIVIAKPKGEAQCRFASTSQELRAFDPDGCNSKLWDMEAVLLERGTKM